MCNFEHFGEFIDLMLGCSLFPRTTLPTRTTKHSCTLIDNALCKLSTDLKNVKAGIILSDISDHYPYYASIRGENTHNVERKVKFVRKEIHSQAAYEGFLNDLRSSNAALALNQDPYAYPNKIMIYYIITLLQRKINTYQLHMSSSTSTGIKETNGLRKMSWDQSSTKTNFLVT